MPKRFCPKCSADVEETDGHCLLGHRMTLAPPVASLSKLRAESNERRDEISEAVVSPLIAEPETDSAEAPDGPAAALAEVRPLPTAPRSEPWSAPRTARDAAWDAFAGDPIDPAHDPIAAFAPAPRMDWGPKRTLLHRRRSSGPMHPTEA